MLLHCSLALEILQDVHNPDVILVPCGGGALLAGVAAAVKIAGHTRCRVYGIEPQGGKYHMRKMTTSVRSYLAVTPYCCKELPKNGNGVRELL